MRVLQVAILWYSVFTFLCGFAQNFEQLFILRALHGLGFGGEWAAGAVLMGEVIRDSYRGRGVGFSHEIRRSDRPEVPAALVYARCLYAVLPEAIALARIVRGWPAARIARALDPPLNIGEEVRGL